MKNRLLIILFLFLSLTAYSQSTRIVTYPISLIFNKHLEGCLKQYNLSLKEVEQYGNTFVSTLDFVERFKNSCDPNIFEFYARNDKPLWKIDLEVAAYYDSLSVMNGILEEKADLNKKEDKTESDYSKQSREFKKFSALKKGELKVIDYRAINHNSKTLVSDLQQLGLSKEEYEKYIQLLK